MDFDNAVESGAGLLLWGDVGTGKTHLACAIANSLLMQRYTVVYTSALELVAGLKASWKATSREEGELAFYRNMAKPDLMIIDEIGMQHDSDFERVVLSAVVEARSRDCRPIIAISNLEPSKIIRVVGQRAFDRLIGYDSEILKFEGASLRKRVQRSSSPG